MRFPNISAALRLSVVATAQLSPSEREEIVDLCTRAFDENFSSLFHYVQSANHVLAHLDGRLVGHAVWARRRLQAEGGRLLRTAYVDAVATDPALWGQGVGSTVMRCLGEETRDYDIGGLSTDRPDFYRRVGWERWLGPTAARKGGAILPTPDDTVMILRTPRTPTLDLRTLLTVEWRDGSPW